jgi:hypothetical protein
MAKTVGGIPTDSEGNVLGKPVAGKVRKVKEVDFPVTVVDSAWKRFKRAAVG